MYRYPDAVIMVFCKAPIPGQVKTRLIPPLTGDEAAQLHCELTERAFKTVTGNNLCPVQLWCAPDISHPYFTGLEQAYKVERKLQQGKDLGERMRHAFDVALSQYKVAIIVGCDCPTLTNGDIDQALVYLNQGEPCVISPAEDGGYVLIGLTQQLGFLFADMPWGTANVFALTQARLKTHELSHKLLNKQWDVDTVCDLQRYHNLKKPYI